MSHAEASPTATTGSITEAPAVVMLLDNHYAPDPRVALEVELLRDAGIAARVVAWDRRSEPGYPSRSGEAALVRFAVPAPSGGGLRTLVAMLRFARKVWRRRRELFGGAAVMVVHDVYLLPLGWALARRLRMPFVYDAHEEYALMEAGRYPSWLLRLVTAVESRLARDAIGVVVPGASRVPRWNGVLSKPPIVLPNLVRHRAVRDEAAPDRAEWDLLYAGTISDTRRPDLLVQLARERPDLRVGIAGRGRAVDLVEAAAAELSNLEYLGWRDDSEVLFARARALYYGLDPAHPYSDVACPNTLYQALIYRRPLIFFCRGEMSDLAAAYNIGVRCEPTVGALSDAVDRVLAGSDWQFDEAWQAVLARAQTQDFVETMRSSAPPPR